MDVQTMKEKGICDSDAYNFHPVPLQYNSSALALALCHINMSQHLPKVLSIVIGNDAPS